MKTIPSDRFLVNIRRTNRQRIMNDLRRNFHYGCPPLEQICHHLQLENSEYTIQEIIKEKQEQLLTVNQLKQGKSMLKSHLDFFAYIAQQIHSKQYEPTAFLINFLMQYIKYNPYQSISFDPLYEKKLINVLELIAEKLSTPQKHSLIKWLEGTQTITLLSYCIDRQNVYLMVIGALKMKKITQNYHKYVLEGLDIVRRICDAADMNQIYYISLQYPELMISIATMTLENIHDKEIIILASSTICSLMNTYTETVENYAIDGIAYLATLMIQSKEENTIIAGLQILSIFSCVDKVQLMEFLCTNEELLSVGIWQRFKVGSELYTHESISIRSKSVWIVANVISNCNFQVVCKFMSLLAFQECTIIDQMRAFLAEERNQMILENCISILSMLMVYGKEHSQNGQNIIKSIILSKGIIPLIQEHLNNEKLQEFCSNFLLGFEQE